MKLLLDECTPARLRFDFAGHEVRTLDEAGLKGFEERRTASHGEPRIWRADYGRSEHPVPTKSIRLINCSRHHGCRSNRYSDLRVLAPKVLDVLGSITIGNIIRVGL